MSAPDVERLVKAAKDALSGWRYIRQTHGDLYGVGWDRVEDSLTEALSSRPDSIPPQDDVAGRLAARAAEEFRVYRDRRGWDADTKAHDTLTSIIEAAIREAYRANPSGWIPVGEGSDKERLDWLLSVIRAKGVDGLLELPWRLVDDDPESDPAYPEDDPERLTPVLDREVIDSAMSTPPTPAEAQAEQREWEG